jgi:hypothetical protein
MTTVLCTNAYKAAQKVYTPASKLPKNLKILPVLHTMKLHHHEGRMALTQMVYDPEKDKLSPLTEYFPARIDGDLWETCVPARPFKDWLSVTQTKPNKHAIGRGVSDQIDLTLDEKTQTLKIKAGNTRAEFKCIDAREFPPC